MDASREVLSWRKTFRREKVGRGGREERALERREAALDEERVSMAKRFGIAEWGRVRRREERGEGTYRLASCSCSTGGRR
mgnify:CR=1 FL=1